MPEPDPVPTPRHSTIRVFSWIFRLLALLSIAIAGIAVVLVARSDPQPASHINLLIATALGIGLTVLVGTGLMTLVFISSARGHDDAAAGPPEKKEAE